MRAPNSIDDLARRLTGATSRRVLLRLLGVSLATSLTSLADGDAAARKKRARRKQQRRRRRRAAQQSSCIPEANSATCAGRCGTVTNQCGQAVTCAACGASSQPPPGVGSGAGCSVTNGSNLQAAIDAAPEGSTLTICAGTFGRVTVGKHLSLVGAGSGGNSSGATILDGSNSGTVITVSKGVAVTLQNLRITGGYAQTGGGILNEGVLIVQGCVITGNATPQATQGTGGGIANIGNGIVTLVSSTITNNTAFNGGGISQQSLQSLSLERCSVRQNTASLGGGMLAGLGTVAVKTGTSISDNQSEIFGGGLVVLVNGIAGFDPTCSVTGNNAQSGLGGGIYNNGTVHLGGAKVSGNTPQNCSGSAPVPGCST